MSTFESDLALAMRLQEEEDRRSNEFLKADRELAEKIKVGDVIDLCSSSDDDEEELYNKPSSSKYQPPPRKRSTTKDEMSSFWLALQLQQQQQEQNDFALAKKLENKVDSSILDEEIPDLYQLFSYFDETYFNNQLGMVEVKWSTKMTRCAGTCTYRGLGNCLVTLSEPLLKFRPKKDMFETLLHEMIHALLFLTNNNTDRDGHGPEFLKEAKRINDAGNYNISVFHNFHDEVNHYLTHVWKCNGPCQNKPPYFGTVKRAVNRPPQKADYWFEEHQQTCGGTYTKISEPPAKEKKRKREPKQKSTLDNYFTDVNDKMKKLKEF